MAELTDFWFVFLVESLRYFTLDQRHEQLTPSEFQAKLYENTVPTTFRRDL